jgi:hypothetical protein
MDERRKFFDAIFSECEARIELRAFAKGAPDRRTFCAVGDFASLERFCQTCQGYNVYFGCGARDGSGCGCKENVLEVPTLWCDVDFKDIPATEVKPRLSAFPHRPTIAVLTGHGVHFYWVLREPARPVDFAVVEDTLRRIANHFQGDRSACEVARVLRVPGTMNVKREPKPVRVRWVESWRYSLEDFEDLPAVVEPTRPGRKTNNPPGWLLRAFAGVPEGGNEDFSGRDAAGAKIAGYYANLLSSNEVFQILKCWNLRNIPPMPDADLQRIAKSVARYATGEQRNERTLHSIDVPVE